MMLPLFLSDFMSHFPKKFAGLLVSVFVVSDLQSQGFVLELWE